MSEPTVAHERGDLLASGVAIHQPPELTSIATGQVGADGTMLRAPCVSCHTLEGVSPDFVTDPSRLGPPHEGIELVHGTLACASCHHERDRLLLRDASGASLAMVEVMTLCAQCHGPQHRDYQSGSHGGGLGSWERGRDRLKAHCIDCHDPHRPAYPSVQPMPPPRDRIAPASHGGGA